VGASSVAHAALPEVWLDVERCERLPAAEVRRLFAADLGAELADRDAPDGTTVLVSCEGNRVFLVVADHVSRKQVERVLDLHAVEPDAESRLVAIAASELVLASWAELAVNPNPRVLAEGGLPDEEARVAARARVDEGLSEAAATEGTEGERSSPTAGGEDAAGEEEPQPMLRIVGFASTRQILDTPGRLWGAGFRLGHDLPGVVAWSSDVLFESGKLGPRGVEIFAAMGSGSVFYQYRVGPVTGRLGAGLRFGLTTSSVGNTTGRSTIAPWGWPMLATSVTVRAFSSFVADVRAEGGYTVLPVASPEPGATLRGVWLGVQLGVGMWF
jgi:hypothetical protein